MYDGTTPTKFGRYHVADPFRPELLHLHRGEKLKPVQWEIPLPVLDQEDLLAQGIDTSALVPGAQKVDALGSCTCNAGTVSLAERYATTHGLTALGTAKFGGITLSNTDAVADEKFAISLYHAVTDQTGDPSQEWPPTDCGSTGLYVCQELQKRKLIGSYKTATGAANAASLLQSGTVIFGTPFFNSWMEPDGHGFIDGDGSWDALQTSIASGVAGGHEMCSFGLEAVAYTKIGTLDLDNTVALIRNSWSGSWGDAGSCRIHLSTLNWLSGSIDYKQFVV
jgi:hypothetical protein